MTPDEYATVVKESSELQTTFYVGIASFTVLIWDHLITLPDEIEYVWKRHKSPLIYLFFLNRYLTPLGFIVNLFGASTHERSLSIRRCNHFVRYEGSMTVIGINVAALMMLLRIYAMYERNKLIVGFVTALFIVELGVNAWLLTNGIGTLPSMVSIHACGKLTGVACSKGPIASASAWLPLLFDTVVLILTLNRTYTGIMNPTAGRIMRTLLKEGLMYYSVIFVITLILTLMIVSAPDGLKNVTAQTEYLMTVAMMSRITLHLKKHADAPTDSLGLFSSSEPPPPTRTSRVRGLRFARGSASVGTALNITVQEYSTVHDDRGEELPAPPSRARAKRGSEWHEMAPVRVSIPSVEPARGRGKGM
ncbi:hypothetical protein C2E23DRAFT_725762 [Lenzites betulinus]|nr:hypothetical protein C2E23DRAFT_725762 [Lenzites betulinus]